MQLSIYKINKLVKKHKFSAFFLDLILIFSFIIPIIKWSGAENSSQIFLIYPNNFISDEVSSILSDSYKFSSDRLNGSDQKNVTESKLIIEKSTFFNNAELKYYLNLDVILASLELPDLINFIPRSPPQVLS